MCKNCAFDDKSMAFCKMIVLDVLINARYGAIQKNNFFGR